jgi:hypothetical protein
MTNLFTQIDKCLLKWIWFNTNRRYKWHCWIPVLKRLFIQNLCKRSRCLEENPVFLFLSKKKKWKKRILPKFASSLFDCRSKITPPKTPNSGQFSFLLPNIVSFLFRLQFRFRSRDFSFYLFPVWQPYWWRFWSAIVPIHTFTINAVKMYSETFRTFFSTNRFVINSLIKMLYVKLKLWNYFRLWMLKNDSKSQCAHIKHCSRSYL